MRGSLSALRKGEKMLVEVKTKETAERLLDELKKDIPNCVYFYMDLKKYGLSNPNIRFWMDKEPGSDRNVRIAIMRYHDGLQMYSKGEDWDTQEIRSFIIEQNVTRISGTESVIRRLEPLLAERYTEASYGVIFRETKEQIYVTAAQKYGEFAGMEDIPEIVELLLGTKEFGEQYSRRELTQQLQERFRTNMGRSFVIRDQGKIIAHTGTFAEVDQIAVASGLVIAEGYQGTDCFELLNREFSTLMCIDEGKEIFFSH